MVHIERQAEFAEKAECPKCRNRDGIKDGGPALRGHRAYDVRTDTFGLCRCPKCGLKAHWSEFHKPKPK
jgi:predicted nucleic-acid-binding Zn-ribbon protein